MHINSSLYFKSGKSLFLPVMSCKDIYGFYIKLSKEKYFFRGGFTPFNNGSTNNVSDNKYCVNKLLELEGLPVPKAIGISKEEFEDNTWDLKDLKFPVVIKPTIGTSCGTDVLCNIKDIKTLKYHLSEKFKDYQYLSIEEFINNLNSYRVLVFYGKVIGVVKRIPAQIIGDGQHSIIELIKIENEKRKCFSGKVTFGDLKIDEESKIILEEQQLIETDIPNKGAIVKLCYNCNSTRGGTMISLGKQIDKTNATILCNAAKVLNLNIVGFDFLCENINIPINKTKGVIIEANYHPDITIHEYPMYGVNNRVSKTIMKRFFYMHPFWGMYYMSTGLLFRLFSRLKKLAYNTITSSLAS